VQSRGRLRFPFAALLIATLATLALGCGTSVPVVSSPAWPVRAFGRDADVVRIVPSKKKLDDAGAAGVFARLYSSLLFPRMHGFAGKEAEESYGWKDQFGVGWVSIQRGARVDAPPQRLAKTFHPPFRHPNGVTEMHSLTPGAENGTPSVFLFPGALVQASGTEDRVRSIPPQHILEEVDVPGDVVLAFAVQGILAERFANEISSTLSSGVQRITVFARRDRLDARLWYDTPDRAERVARAIPTALESEKKSCTESGAIARAIATVAAEADGRAVNVRAKGLSSFAPKCPSR
jgi:hypothetical protein